MLSPVAIATWIAFCIPWAEPQLAAALVDAGSAGEPYLVTDTAGERFVGATAAQGANYLRERSKARNGVTQAPLFIGLTQIPGTKLAQLGIAPQSAIDTCSNLEIGYHLFLQAYAHAETVERSPWKRTSLAYGLYRSGQILIDTPFAKRATDYLMKSPRVMPATLNDPVYHRVAAQWSAGFAQRQAQRASADQTGPLAQSARLVRWARQ